MFGPFERMVAGRYLRARKGEGAEAQIGEHELHADAGNHRDGRRALRQPH